MVSPSVFAVLRLIASSYLVGGFASGPAGLDPHVTTVNPAQLLQPLLECRKAGLPFRIVRGDAHEHADAPYALTLLCVRDEWPSGGAAK